MCSGDLGGVIVPGGLTINESLTTTHGPGERLYRIDLVYVLRPLLPHTNPLSLFDSLSCVRAMVPFIVTETRSHPQSSRARFKNRRRRQKARSHPCRGAGWGRAGPLESVKGPLGRAAATLWKGTTQ